MVFVVRLIFAPEGDHAYLMQNGDWTWSERKAARFKTEAEAEGARQQAALDYGLSLPYVEPVPAADAGGDGGDADA